jgi:hypothetical protein
MASDNEGHDPLPLTSASCGEMLIIAAKLMMLLSGQRYPVSWNRLLTGTRFNPLTLRTPRGERPI